MWEERKKEQPFPTTGRFQRAELGWDGFLPTTDTTLTSSDSRSRTARLMAPSGTHLCFCSPSGISADPFQETHSAGISFEKHTLLLLFCLGHEQWLLCQQSKPTSVKCNFRASKRAHASSDLRYEQCRVSLSVPEQLSVGVGQGS